MFLTKGIKMAFSLAMIISSRSVWETVLVVFMQLRDVKWLFVGEKPIRFKYHYNTEKFCQSAFIIVIGIHLAFHNIS